MAGWDNLIKEVLSNTSFAKKKSMEKLSDRLKAKGKAFDDDAAFFDDWANEGGTAPLHEYLRQQARKEHNQFYDPVRDEIDFSLEDYLREKGVDPESLKQKLSNAKDYVSSKNASDMYGDVEGFVEDKYNKAKQFIETHPKTAIGAGSAGILAAILPEDREYTPETELQKQLLIATLQKQGMTPEQIEQYFINIEGE